MKTRHYFILLALAEGDRHGLAIARGVRELSEDRVRLWPATLYGSLEELVERGWIEELDGTPHRPADESEKKRFYRLSKPGQRAMAAETERLAGIVKVARSRLRPRGASS
ncbi:MAG: helix-turn-helix transcriptional regulator [Vicinamibacterales bacterium]